MWPRTDFLELLGITHPVIQAPMAASRRRHSPRRCATRAAWDRSAAPVFRRRRCETRVSALRQATNRPYNLNFFVHSHPRLDPDATARMRARLAVYFDEFGLGAVPEPKELFPPFDEEQLALVLELRPRVVSFHFGLPDATAVRRVKEAGCIILSSATTVAEARWLEANGADVIIAQGFEAGGHRGSFSDSPGAGMVGTMALVPANRRCRALAGNRRRRHRRWARHRGGLRSRRERGPARHGFSWDAPRPPYRRCTARNCAAPSTTGPS